MTKWTINELAYAKGTSEPVRQALLLMQSKLNAPWGSMTLMQSKLNAPWVSLTPEEILDLFDVNNVYGSKWVEFARAVEAKLKEKNHD
jgi:hypothetical protein